MYRSTYRIAFMERHGACRHERCVTVGPCEVSLLGYLECLEIWR